MPFCRILCVLGRVYRMQYKNTLIVIYCSKTPYLFETYNSYGSWRRNFVGSNKY